MRCAFPRHHCRLSKSGHRNQVKPTLNGLADSGSRGDVELMYNFALIHGFPLSM
jgi:hypothetical protein